MKALGAFNQENAPVSRGILRSAMIVKTGWETDVCNTIYRKTVQSCYSKLALPVMMFIALWCGFFFGTLAFLQIWLVQPCKKMMQLNGIMFRRFTQQCYGECAASIVHVWRLSLGGSQIKISTLNTELNGVFLRKKHSPLPLDGSFKSGNIRDKSKEKYPKIQRIKLPFTTKFKKEVAKKMIFMKQALQIVMAKLPSFEIMESAYRLAVVKREENIKGDELIKQSFALARSRRGGQGGGEEEDTLRIELETKVHMKVRNH